MFMKDESQDERISANENSINLINQKLDFISEQIKDIKLLLTEGYVTKVEFDTHDKRICKLEDSISRVVWLILSPVIGGAVVAAAVIISKNL
jgi:hypothetical protein